MVRGGPTPVTGCFDCIICDLDDSDLVCNWCNVEDDGHTKQSLTIRVGEKLCDSMVDVVIDVGLMVMVAAVFVCYCFGKNQMDARALVVHGGNCSIMEKARFVRRSSASPTSMGCGCDSPWLKILGSSRSSRSYQ
ncbi:uncharacterized protein HKW66_Vig0112030 [Vigna angularis]|uniref:Uncharacterized protein n=1 Tax=Phaseolus angularis TaxID=3914 RepID=A0A8T0KY28_PHAAN|nr:uncharacterized protein HKW66_Vig0112030 [Vigna angularis]